MKEEKCIFCNYELIKDDILFNSNNFFVKVGVGILAPGHIMLITKSHIKCFAQLPVNFRKEFLTLKENIFKKIKTNFHAPIIYEHGIYSQSIKHAHIHFIPQRNDFYNLNNIKEKLSNNMKITRINNLFDIENVFKSEGSYFYIEENNEKWVFHTKGLQENKFNFRIEFARLTGLKGLINWRNMDEKEKVRNKEWVKITKEVFKR